MSFSLTRSAEADLSEVADDIGEEQGADASRRWLDAVEARSEARGPAWAGPVAMIWARVRRSILFRSYIVVCRSAGDDAVIPRVAHGRRDLSRLSFDG